MDVAYQIRRAETTDVPRVADIERRVFTTPWPESSFHRFLGDLFLVVTAGTRVVGYAVGRMVLDEGEVLNVAVAQSQRRQGLGRRLLLSLVARLADNGAEVVYLEVRESNRAAIALYHGFGFSVVGRRPSYYTSPTEDALVLRLEIDGVTGVTKKG